MVGPGVEATGSGQTPGAETRFAGDDGPRGSANRVGLKGIFRPARRLDTDARGYTERQETIIDSPGISSAMGPISVLTRRAISAMCGGVL